VTDGGTGLVRAAGSVPWRTRVDGVVEVVLAHRPRYDDWSLPKGKLEAGEPWTAAALRETEEETGLRGDLGPELCGVAYRVAVGPKLVRYWLVRVTGGEFRPNHEVDRLHWLPLDDAVSSAPYASDRAVLRSAASVLQPHEPGAQQASPD
jgi:8-oxo-(d)GTP phosphatase